MAVGKLGSRWNREQDSWEWKTMNFKWSISSKAEYRNTTERGNTRLSVWDWTTINDDESLGYWLFVLVLLAVLQLNKNHISQDWTTARFQQVRELTFHFSMALIPRPPSRPWIFVAAADVVAVVVVLMRGRKRALRRKYLYRCEFFICFEFSFWSSNQVLLPLP